MTGPKENTGKKNSRPEESKMAQYFTGPKEKVKWGQRKK
jgi:hypothetical protein